MSLDLLSWCQISLMHNKICIDVAVVTNWIQAHVYLTKWIKKIRLMMARIDTLQILIDVVAFIDNQHWFWQRVDEKLCRYTNIQNMILPFILSYWVKTNFKQFVYVLSYKYFKLIFVQNVTEIPFDLVLTYPVCDIN